MKGTIIFIAFLLSISFTSFAGSSEKEYKKIVEKHDVPPEAKVSDTNNPTSYWDALLNSNDQLFSFINNIHKMKGAEKEALDKVSQIPHFNPKYEPSICDEMQGFCDTLLINMGISVLNVKCSLHVVYGDEANAFTALTDDGFAMCLTTGLITKKGCTYEMLMAVVAHEFAHGAYFHHLQRFYAEAKEKRKNELIGGIVGGLSAGHQAYAKARGVEPMTSTIDMGEFHKKLKSETAKYVFKFSREQEFEADIVAFRFMQWIGEEDAAIELLKFLGTDFDFLHDEYSDHPTTSDRIALLTYIKNHPEINNKEIEKLRKKNNKKK